MSHQEVDIVKRYLDSHLVKGIIQASLVPYLSPVFLVKKLDKKIPFYIDYQRSNAMIKKNRYSILLIKKTLV